MSESVVLDETDAETAARFERDVIPLLDPLFGAAMRMTLQRAQAEDLAQETLVRAYAEFHTIQPGTHLTAWLFRLQADGYRKRMRCLTDTTSDRQPTDDLQSPPRALCSADVEVLESLPDNEIANALDALPLESRMAVHYADVEKLRYTDISDITGAPLGTVISRIHRGRTQLRVLLADLAADRGNSMGQHRSVS